MTSYNLSCTAKDFHYSHIHYIQEDFLHYFTQATAMQGDRPEDGGDLKRINANSQKTQQLKMVQVQMYVYT